MITGYLITVVTKAILGELVLHYRGRCDYRVMTVFQSLRHFLALTSPPSHLLSYLESCTLLDDITKTN